ncbi:hypothetical protein MKZ38_006830 [Zalerion maritima]|uniref:Transcription factor domain-containing protein n=1 Tax=Zalerion maritima TaxID=339359 RepID=A0AAD5RW63_9PEZI|nr:hypothetical protein MKZ38_006830 [Zalerion maritima]
MMGLKRLDQAFLYLRQGIAQMQPMGIHDPKIWEEDVDGKERRRRSFLYWELFVHERFLAIVSSYPAVLSPFLGGMSQPGPSIPHHVHAGFCRVIKLFSLIDEKFLAQWLKTSHHHLIGASWIAGRQRLLDEDEAAHAVESPSVLSTAAFMKADMQLSIQVVGLSSLQHAGLFVTRLWLRTVVWQLAMSRCLLSSSDTVPEALSRAFPIKRVLKQLRRIVEPRDAMWDMRESIALHGSGICRSCSKS